LKIRDPVTVTYYPVYTDRQREICGSRIISARDSRQTSNVTQKKEAEEVGKEVDDLVLRG
jgi:hypothetical protein